MRLALACHQQSRIIENIFSIFIRLGWESPTIENHEFFSPKFIRLGCLLSRIDNHRKYFFYFLKTCMRIINNQELWLKIFCIYKTWMRLTNNWESYKILDVCNQQLRLIEYFFFSFYKTRMLVINNRILYRYFFEIE